MGYPLPLPFLCIRQASCDQKVRSPLLMNAEQKARMLHSYGMDHVILRDFDDELAHVSSNDFGVFLKERIPSVEGLSVGQNFRFGKGREGDSSFLQEVGEKMGMNVQVVNSKIWERLR